MRASVLAGDGIGAHITIVSIEPVSAGGRVVLKLEFDVTNQSGIAVQRGVNRPMAYA